MRDSLVRQPLATLKNAVGDAMVRTGSARATAARAYADTSDHVWWDVKFGCLGALATGVLSAAAGLPWFKVTLLALAGYSGVFVVLYLFNLARVVRHPDRSRAWTLTRKDVVNDGRTIWLEAEPTRPMFAGRNACEITSPDGRVWLEGHNPDERPQLVHGLQVFYPDGFEGAPPVEPGTYKVRWLIGRGARKWREILRFDVHVS